MNFVPKISQLRDFAFIKHPCCFADVVRENSGGVIPREGVGGSPLRSVYRFLKNVSKVFRYVLLKTQTDMC